jgi:primosomal replication protein N
MLPREAILEEQQAAATGLTNDQVELAIVAKVSGNDGAAITVAIRTGEIADVHEVLATDI